MMKIGMESQRFTFLAQAWNQQQNKNNEGIPWSNACSQARSPLQLPLPTTRASDSRQLDTPLQEPDKTESPTKNASLQASWELQEPSLILALALEQLSKPLQELKKGIFRRCILEQVMSIEVIS